MVGLVVAVVLPFVGAALLGLLTPPKGARAGWVASAVVGVSLACVAVALPAVRHPIAPTAVDIVTASCRYRAILASECRLSVDGDAGRDADTLHERAAARSKDTGSHDLLIW